MEGQYTVYNNMWRDVTGNSMNMVFTSPGPHNVGFGGNFWGLKETINQPRSSAPKYNSVRSFIDQNPTG